MLLLLLLREEFLDDRRLGQLVLLALEPIDTSLGLGLEEEDGPALLLYSKVKLREYLLLLKG